MMTAEDATPIDIESNVDSAIPRTGTSDLRFIEWNHWHHLPEQATPQKQTRRGNRTLRYLCPFQIPPMAASGLLLPPCIA